MKIKMLTLQAGPAGVRQPGSEHDVSDEEAAMLIEGGYAVAVSREDSVRRDTPIERAAVQPTRRRGRGKPQTDQQSPDGESDQGESEDEED